MQQESVGVLADDDGPSLLEDGSHKDRDHNSNRSSNDEISEEEISREKISRAQQQDLQLGTSVHPKSRPLSASLHRPVDYFDAHSKNASRSPRASSFDSLMTVVSPVPPMRNSLRHSTGEMHKAERGL